MENPSNLELALAFCYVFIPVCGVIIIITWILEGRDNNGLD